MKKFLRRDAKRHSKLGKNRKKLLKWRRPKGRDTKTRLKRKGYPKTVSIGYKSSAKERKIPPTMVYNITELNKLSENSKVILAKIGARKKLEIIKQAQEKNIKIVNIGGKNETGK